MYESLVMEMEEKEYQESLRAAAEAARAKLKATTYRDIAIYLLEKLDYYFAPDVSIHCYIDPFGSVKYFGNYKGTVTRDYATVKTLFEKMHLTLPLELG